MDGPVIKDAKIAIERNNVNYVLKWVRPENEAEVKDVFNHMMRVRELSPEAKILQRSISLNACLEFTEPEKEYHLQE